MTANAINYGQPLLWVILAAGFLSFVTFIERAFHLHRARIRTQDFLNGVFNILRKGNVSEALIICDETPGPVACIVRTAVERRGEQREALRDALREAALIEIARMERRIGVLAIVAQTAPLLGLLGTVFGLMEMFRGMQVQAPFIQMAHVTHGIASALVSTAAGLTVSIPSYAGFGLLVARIDGIVLDIEKAAGQMLAFLKGGGNETGAAERK